MVERPFWRVQLLIRGEWQTRWIESTEQVREIERRFKARENLAVEAMDYRQELHTARCCTAGHLLTRGGRVPCAEDGGHFAFDCMPCAATFYDPAPCARILRTQHAGG